MSLVRLLPWCRPANRSEHLRYAVYEFAGGRWRQYNPTRHENLRWRDLRRFIAGFFRKRSGRPDGEADRSAIEHRSKNVVSVDFADALIVAYPHCSFFGHCPLLYSFGDKIMRSGRPGVES